MIEAGQPATRQHATVRTSYALLLLSILSLGTAACTRSEKQVRGPIALIVVDTLRADHLTCYGYQRPTSPTMCSLADDGVRFTRAYTPRTVTTPAIASMLTGLYPHRHGVAGLYFVLPREITTLPQLLRRRGYRTGAFVSSFVMVQDFSGFAPGFEVYDDDVRTPEPFRENYERPAGRTVARALRWLRSVGPEAFLFVHLIEPHGPYTPSPPFQERFALPAKGTEVLADQLPLYQRIPGVRFANEFVGRYDGEIASADDQIGRLLAKIREWGWYESATIILVSDHGESMGEENRWFEHGRSVHDAEAHVPLLIKFAISGPTLAGMEIREPVSTVDIFATVLGAANLSGYAKDSQGVDLRTLLDGGRRSKSPPLTQLRKGGALTIAAHGIDCSARWKIQRSVLAKLEADPAIAPRWSDLAVSITQSPAEAAESCKLQIERLVTPLVTDLLTFKLTVPVVRRRMDEPGERTRFIRERKDRVIPLKEHEREALRRLGYLD